MNAEQVTGLLETHRQALQVELGQRFFEVSDSA